MAVITKWLIQYPPNPDLNPNPEILQCNHTLIASSQNYCGGVQRQNHKNYFPFSTSHRGFCTKLITTEKSFNQNKEKKLSDLMHSR